MNLRSTVEGLGLRALTALPAQVQRTLSGGATVRDGQTLAPDLGLMLKVQNLTRSDAELPVEQLRERMRVDAALVGGRQPIGSVRSLTVAGRPARHFLPSVPLAASGEAGPLLVYVHGGGFVEGDLDTHDATCRLLAELSGVPVVAVTYGLAPEAKFPIGHDDAYAAYLDVLNRADELGADPARIAVGGDSAGGNLAAWIAIRAARERLPVAFQLLIYPTVDGHHATESKRLFGNGFFLTDESMARYDRELINGPADLDDERISTIRAELPAGLAPAYVCTAGFDPLRDEAEAYAKRMATEGHVVELERFSDQIHGFVNMLLVPSCRAATGAVAARLRTAMTA
ncbi:alpha/beta hydrolase [Nocardioides montaniterrae]